MANARLARLLRLITVLRAPTAGKAGTLAGNLGVSERTIYRDLNALELAGVPYYFDQDANGYRVRGDFFLPPLQLTLAEALSLSVVASEVKGRSRFPFMEDAWKAVNKIESQLPAAIRDELASTDGLLRVDGARVSPQKGCDHHFEVLRRAIAARRKVRCTYDDGRRKWRTPFLFRPYSLYFGQRAWYVIGHSESKNAERCLKLNRLTQVTPTDLPYMIPDDWSLEKSLGHAWRMIRGSRRYKVAVQFEQDFGRNVADTLWHPTQTIAWQPNGDCVFTCTVDGLDEIVWWVLSYGPHAKVLEPPELRARIIDMAARLTKLYGSVSRTGRRKISGHRRREFSLA